MTHVHSNFGMHIAFLKTGADPKTSSYREEIMGAYSSGQCSAHNAWKLVVRKRQKLIFCPQYRKAMHDECMMAVVFGYTAPLLEKILTYSLPSEYESVKDLFSNTVNITINKGNLVISN